MDAAPLRPFCFLTSSGLIICVMMTKQSNNCIVLLGPTASGKTELGAQLAAHLGGEIISADSRQVYRGLDIGAGKDLDAYVVDGQPIPYHLINVADLTTEYSVFHYQQDFYPVFEDLLQRRRLPVIVGGTGLYLNAVLCGYRMLPTPENTALRRELAGLDDEQLRTRLATARPQLHNTTDTQTRDRLVRAIEIAEYARAHPPPPCPDVRAHILGIVYSPEALRKRIAARLKTRLDHGLLEEVASLHEQGCTWERLELLGLEYRFVAQYLQGSIKNKNDLFQNLNTAIAQFAKRQRTWFRGMERKGFVIHWLPDNHLSNALDALQDTVFIP